LTAIAQVSVFAALTMLSLGFERKTTAVVAAVVCVGSLVSVVALACARPFLSSKGLNSEGEASSEVFGSAASGFKATNAEEDRPRWERRWAKTEAKRLKRKESKTKERRSRALQSIELEAKERAKRAELASRHREERETARRERELQKLDKKRACEAAEKAKERLQALKGKRLDEERRAGRERRAEKKRAEYQKKLEERRAERRAEKKRWLKECDLVVADAVALDAIALAADRALLAALAVVAEAPQKRRSSKSKAFAKKARDKANERKKIAEDADQQALNAARRAERVLNEGKKAFFPEGEQASLKNNIKKKPIVERGDDDDDEDLGKRVRDNDDDDHHDHHDHEHLLLEEEEEDVEEEEEDVEEEEEDVEEEEEDVEEEEEEDVVPALPPNVRKRLGAAAATKVVVDDDEDDGLSSTTSSDRRSIWSSDKKEDDAVSNDSGETARAPGADAAPVYIETPAEIKRLIEQVRSKHTKACHVDNNNDDKENPHLRCQ